MFKKYFAHEFKNTCQMPLTICAIIIGVSLLVGIGALLDLDFLFELGIIASAVSVNACIIMSYVSIHKTITGRLFSSSGYLTLTLPVGTHTILISKILINIIYSILYVTSFIIAILILVFGFSNITDIGEMFEDAVILFSEMFKIFDVILIELLFIGLCFTFFLCVLLFVNTIKHSGFVKKQSKTFDFFVLVIFVICIAYILSLNIIPYSLCFDQESRKYLIISAEEYSFNYFKLFDFSALFWVLFGTTGFYLGSYYLIKNKIDII